MFYPKRVSVYNRCHTVYDQYTIIVLTLQCAKNFVEGRGKEKHDISIAKNEHGEILSSIKGKYLN
jgi:hypothetical protein